MTIYYPSENDPAVIGSTPPGPFPPDDGYQWYYANATLWDSTLTPHPTWLTQLRSYDPDDLLDDSDFSVAVLNAAGPTVVEHPAINVYFRTGEQRYNPYTNVFPDPFPPFTKGYVLHYDVRAVSSNPPSPMTWRAPSFLGGAVTSSGALVPWFGGLDAAVLEHNVWTTITETGDFGMWPSDYEIRDLVFLLQCPNASGVYGYVLDDPDVADETEFVGQLELHLRNVWLEVIDPGGAPTITPALRMGQRDDGAGGVTGHARQNNGAANQPSSVQDSRSPRLPETIANRYV